jgi:hypothetical protein
VIAVEQEKVDVTVSSIPPATGDVLVAWVLMAEWREADGQTKLTRLISSGSSAWQAKGYLHEGLNTQWPTGNLPHHNPGYLSGWTRLDDR